MDTPAQVKQRIAVNTHNADETEGAGFEVTAGADATTLYIDMPDGGLMSMSLRDIFAVLANPDHYPRYRAPAEQWSPDGSAAAGF